ncbi:MAG: hypothetical protein ACFE9L_21170 [Candidatus Hodarchaeota archaeon]
MTEDVPKITFTLISDLTESEAKSLINELKKEPEIVIAKTSKTLSGGLVEAFFIGITVSLSVDLLRKGAPIAYKRGKNLIKKIFKKSANVAKEKKKPVLELHYETLTLTFNSASDDEIERNLEKLHLYAYPE